MDVNNSGATIILDPQSQATVDAIRDRITLMESELSRLGKLKSNIDDAVRKADADLAYKNDLLNEATASLKEDIDNLDSTRNDKGLAEIALKELNDALVIGQKDIDEKSAALTKRELDITNKEKELLVRENDLNKKQVGIDTDTASINEKKTEIQDLLSKL